MEHVFIGKSCAFCKLADFVTELYLITNGNHVRINGGAKFIIHDGGCGAVDAHDAMRNYC